MVTKKETFKANVKTIDLSQIKPEERNKIGQRFAALSPEYSHEPYDQYSGNEFRANEGVENPNLFVYLIWDDSYLFLSFSLPYEKTTAITLPGENHSCL
jgi:hypothetical protein